MASKSNRAFNLDKAVGSGPKPGRRSDQGVVGEVGGRYPAPAPSREPGQATHKDMDLNAFLGRGSNTKKG
ncbi:MAG TPA: hypothetical protein VGJ60_11260 [Chloroflexota bacterium]|jgi:hypothetical protein